MNHAGWKLAAAAIAALFLLWSTRARAADGFGGVAAGAWVPDTGGSNIRRELDNGLAGELRAGWGMGRSFALEIATGGFDADHFLEGVAVTETTLHSVSAVYVLLTGMAVLPLGDGTWRLTGGGGLGYYSAHLHVKEPPATDRRLNERGFGWHLSAGVHLALTRRAGLSLDCRRVMASPGGVDVDGSAVLLASDYRY